MGKMQDTRQPSWEEVAKEHATKQHNNIPAEWRLPQEKLDALSGVGTADEGRLIQLQAARKSGLLSDRELDITENHTARDLLPKLAARELTSVEVTVAFCKRAALAQQLTSCLTEIFFNEAIEKAKEADQYLEKHGEVRGPLHGLPISMKVRQTPSGNVHGAQSPGANGNTCIGLIRSRRTPRLRWVCGVPETAGPQGESTLVKLLQEAGAILYCKTNVPQTMMVNCGLRKQHLRPHPQPPQHQAQRRRFHRRRGRPPRLPRFPAGRGHRHRRLHPYSLRVLRHLRLQADGGPRPLRRPKLVPLPRNHLPGIVPAAGPMANTLADLKVFMDIVIAQRKPWNYDVTAIDIPWRAVEKTEKTKKLVIGIAPEDEEFQLHPPVKRTIDEAAKKLEAAGHTVVRLPADPSRSMALGGRLAFSFYGLEGHPTNEQMVAEFGEPLIKSLAVGVHPFALSPPPLSPEWSVAKKVAEWNRCKEEYTDSWRRAWLDNGLDVVLAPGAISTAVPHDSFGVPVYTAAWNVTNYPACIIPYGKSSKTLDPNPMKGHAAFDADYTPELQDGAPCSVQVITPTFKDEECLHAATIIDEVLNGA
ncbi:hypothetical protein PG987_000620 [Apiospora arundinis]